MKTKSYSKRAGMLWSDPDYEALLSKLSEEELVSCLLESPAYKADPGPIKEVLIRWLEAEYFAEYFIEYDKGTYTTMDKIKKLLKVVNES